MLASVLELEAGAATRSLTVWETSIWCGPASEPHACTDHDTEPSDLSIDDLALTGMYSSSDLNPKGVHGTDDLLRASRRTRRPVERGEEPISCCIDLHATESAQEPPHKRMMAFDNLAPRSIAHRRRGRGRVHDVGEQDRCEHTVRALLLGR
jgi:hypothetical protein